jgi:hypothetical protein
MSVIGGVAAARLNGWRDDCDQKRICQPHG